MENPAAITADYVDTTYMKTTGAVRFVFEVSKEHAEQAKAIMGLPVHGGNKWCAVALLTPQTEETNEQG